MRPTLRQLEYFTTVAELGSFRQAAERLSVTQPSLSKQIVALEAELGFSLFERSSRKVSLSQGGQSLLADAQALLQQARAFKDKARTLSETPDYSLVAGVLPSIGAYFMPRLSDRLRQSFPKLTLSFAEGHSQDLLDRLGAGEIDFVIASTAVTRDVKSRSLFDESLWICSEPDDPVMLGDGEVELSALKGRSLLTLSPEYQLSQIVSSLADRAGAEISTAYQGGSLDAIRQMAATGPAIAVLPSLYALAEAIRDPDFKVRRLADPAAFHPVYLYWRRTAPDQAFYETLAELIMSEKHTIRAERAPEFQI